MTTTVTRTATPLRLAAITARFTAPDGNDIVVLDGLELCVEPGEMVAVCGRSGSGKTTALRIAAGLQRPNAGEVRWGDRRVEGLDDNARARLRRHHVGYVPQSEPLIDWLTAAENVALPAAPDGGRRIPLERVNELLERFDIGHRRRHRPSALSAGEQQRVALARALLLDPPLLLLDEPTANLDRSSAGSVLSALNELRVDARGILVATHDPQLAELADRIVDLT